MYCAPRCREDLCFVAGEIIESAARFNALDRVPV